MYSFCVAIALIFNQYVNPIALVRIKWVCKYFLEHSLGVKAKVNSDYVVYDIWIFIELVVVYFVFIETKGSSLEEISMMIDGHEIKEKLVDSVVQATAADPTGDNKEMGSTMNIKGI